LPAGQGNKYMRIDVGTKSVADNSIDPAAITGFYPLPPLPTPRITRTFHFDRLNGQWSINGQYMDCNTVRVRVGQNTSEQWIITNLSGDWEHPIHIHFEEHRLISRNRALPPPPERGRKDVTRLKGNERNELLFRFRDFHGHYVMHCHNLVHEDHAMMVLWYIDPNGGDNVQLP
jgi:FtsP/CotA-like multicopper oxidase with cupredoxin domain